MLIVGQSSSTTVEASISWDTSVAATVMTPAVMTPPVAVAAGGEDEAAPDLQKRTPHVRRVVPVDGL